MLFLPLSVQPIQLADIVLIFELCAGRFDSRSAFKLSAGSEAAADRIRYFLTGEAAAGLSGPSPVPPPLLNYTVTRALASGEDTSTKLSPFLAQGCCTAREVGDCVRT